MTVSFLKEKLFSVNSKNFMKVKELLFLRKVFPESGKTNVDLLF